jgi:hypothetical protein
MAILKIYWDYVQCLRAVNLRDYAKDSAISFHYNVQPNCRGVYFRSVLTEELDFSDTLKGLRFEDVRRTRSEGGQDLLFVPKPKAAQSIGVLRIMKPRKFNATSGINVTLDKVNMVSRSKDYDVLMETTEFVLEDAQEQMQERFQIQETFGDFNVFFFGKRAEIFTYSGSLLNGCNNLQWRNQFLYNYENFLRGTKCVELKARAYFLYDDIIREGFILGASTGQNSTVDGVVKFSLTMLITDKRTMGFTPSSRSGSLTLDREGDKKQGITDFQYVRSTDPDLPDVSPQIPRRPGDPAVFVSRERSFSFIRDVSLKGDQPTDDLARIMQTRSLKALEQVKQGENVEVSEESLDHDILLEFIDSSLFGSATKRAISGKSLDVNNISGDETVELLIQDALTVTDLRLKDAVAAADAFAGKHAARIGDGLAESLRSLAMYFSKEGTLRIRSPQGKESSYRELLSVAERYILQESFDNLLLTDVIVKVKPLTTVDEDGLTSQAVNNVKVSAMDVFLAGTSGNGKNLSDMLQLYVASVALMKNPQTSAAFPAFSQFSGSIGANSVDYVKSQKFSVFASVAKDLPGQVAPAFDAAVSNFKSSEIGLLIASEVLGNPFDNIPLSNWTLHEATGNLTPMSDVSARFMIQVSVFLSGILPEIAGDMKPTSFDVMGGTVRKVGTVQEAHGIYFTQAYADNLTADADEVRDAVYMQPIEVFGGGTGKWLSRPTPAGDRYIMLPLIKSLTSDFFVRFLGIVIGGNPDQQKLLKAGFLRIRAAQLPAFESSSPIEFIVDGFKRKPNPATKLADLETVNLKAFFGGAGFARNEDLKIGGGGLITSVTQIKKYPVRRKYIGTAQKGIQDYLSPTIGNVKATGITQLGSLVSSSIVQAEEAMNQATTDYIENGIPGTPDETAPIKKELSIENLSTSADIKTLAQVLVDIGATVSDFTDLMFVAKAEVTMAESVIELKDLLTEAVALAKVDDEGRRANVDESDESSKAAICKGD